MITIKDIAKEAGVSYATVSRALNNREDVKPETRRKVLELAKQMGYQPNAIARSLVNQRTNIIALIVPDVSLPFFADLSRSVSNEAEKAGFTTMVCNTGWNRRKEMEMLSVMQEQRVAGIIIKPTGFYEPGTFDAVDTPLVVFWHPTEDKTNYVEVDHSTGSRLAVKHLIDRGFRHIAFMGGSENSPANQLRRLTYQRVLEENDLELNLEHLSFSGYDMQSGYKRMNALMQQTNRPDAVFCSNDYIALGCLQYLQEHNISREEFGLVGYDDLYFSSLPMIDLTTVRQPREELGKEAFRLLDFEIKHYKDNQPESVILQPELIVRRT